MIDYYFRMSCIARAAKSGQQMKPILASRGENHVFGRRLRHGGLAEVCDGIDEYSEAEHHRHGVNRSRVVYVNVESLSSKWARWAEAKKVRKEKKNGKCIRDHSGMY